MIQFNQRILIYLSFVVLANANNLIKKEIKEPKLPKVKVETVHLIQQPKRLPLPLNNQLDNSFMPVFLTSSNVKANDFTQDMLKSLATNNFIKPSVKSLSSINKSSSKNNKSTNDNKKIKNSLSTNSELNRWSKAGSTSNFSPTLPINLNMNFDHTGFIPIVPKQTTRSSSNAKLIKQASKPITSRANVNSKTILLSTKPTQTSLTKQTINSKSKQQLINDLNKLINKDKNVLPNPSIRALKSIKSNIKLSNLRSSSFKPLVKATTIKPLSSTNSKIIDNRPIVASSTELNSYLTSRDARKALLKMNTLRYLAKLSPHWSASSLSETYQTKVGNGPLKAYPLSKITIPASGSDSYGNGYGSKKPDISIELIKEILHKLTNDEVQFNKLYVMGTHRYKEDSNNQQYNNQETSSGGGYQSDNDQYQNGGTYQQDSGNSYQENNNQSNEGYQQEGGYSQPENGYNQQDGYSQPDYSQPEAGNYEGNNGDNSYGSNDSGYSNGDSYSNNNGGAGDSYSNNNNEADNYSNNGGGDNYSNNDGGDNYSNNDQGNSYSNDQGNSNEGGNSYQNEGGNSYQNEGGNSYQNGGDSEQGYHLQSLGYDMSQYDNRAYVPAYSLNSLASFVHSKFKETAMKKQRGEYEFNDNPYVNNYENYKSMDINYAQHVPDQNMNGGGGRKKCSKNKNNQNNQNNQNNGNQNNYANNDVNFDDTYNNYGMPQMIPNIWYNNNNNNGDQNGRSSRCNKHRF